MPMNANSSSDVPVIRFENIHKRFGPLVVLNGLNLDIPADQTTVVIGPSGTGKSVLLKHIVGLLKPDSGKIYFHGRRIDNLPERELEPIRKRFGVLFQLSALFDSMDVGENIAFPLRQEEHLNVAQINDTVHEKLAIVGMAGSERKMPADLSGGQRKRVALARAMAMNPEVLLYDEPTTGLDPIRSDVINELILKLQKQFKVTGIVVTHDMASAFKVADQIVMLLHGKIVYRGTPEEIRTSTDPEVQRFIQGRASEAELDALDRL